MPIRYNYTPREYWPALGPAFRGIDADLTALEANPGIKDRSALTASSPRIDIIPHLPPAGHAGVIRTISRMLIDDSAKWPIQVTWTDRTLLGLIVQNPTDSGTDVRIGPQAVDNLNHTGQENDVIPPGSEWVDTHGARPVRARCATAGKTAVINIIAVRSA